MTIGVPVTSRGRCGRMESAVRLPRASVERKLYGFPSIGLLVTGDLADHVYELALVPLHDSGRSLCEGFGELQVLAEKPDDDQRQVDGLRRVHLIRGPD